MTENASTGTAPMHGEPEPPRRHKTIMFLTALSLLHQMNMRLAERAGNDASTAATGI